jgi:hypothetical protein
MIRKHPDAIAILAILLLIPAIYGVRFISAHERWRSRTELQEKVQAERQRWNSERDRFRMEGERLRAEREKLRVEAQRFHEQLRREGEVLRRQVRQVFRHDI